MKIMLLAYVFKGFFMYSNTSWLEKVFSSLWDAYLPQKCPAESLHNLGILAWLLDVRF